MSVFVITQRPAGEAITQMKKRTVITTEKREVWVISEGGGTQEQTVQPQPVDVGKVDGNQPLVSTDSGDQNAAPVPEEET